MRKKYAAFTLGMVLGLSVLNGCSGNNTDKNTNDTVITQKEESTDTVYGEVSQIDGDTIAIKTGTMKTMEQGEQPSEGQPEDGEAPEKPSGEQPQNGGQPGETPSMLDLTGEEQEIQVTDDTVIKRQSMGGAMEKDKEEGEEQSEEITLADISQSDTIAVVFHEDGSAAEITVFSMMGGVQGGMAQASQPQSYEAVTEYTKDAEAEGDVVTSTGTDENAILISEDVSVTLEGITVDRSSQESEGGDNASFYGVGAAILATDGTAYVSDSTIETDAAGGAGIFAYGEGTVYTADTTFTTQKDTSGGIHAAGGGTLYAWDMNVETNGASAAAIRSDRGGGTMVVDGGTYTSNGGGSPAVYSTADIAVNNAALTANGSEAICIEGLNSLHLYDTDLTGNMSDDEQNDCTWNVILYQSMSGDSEVGNSTFEMNGGTLTAKNGGMFYTTNTESTITLSDVDITYAEENDYFLQCTGNNNQRGWGASGDNGADCLFTAINQSMKGDIIWDSISNLDFYMMEGSTLTGAVKQDETYAGDGGDGYCSLYLAKGCSWTVTGDSVLSTLCSEGTITDEDGNTVTIQGSDGTVYVEGSSDHTITVTEYKDSVDVSGASDTTEWSEYQVEKPSQLS